MNNWTRRATLGDKSPILGWVKKAYENEPIRPAPPVPEDQAATVLL